MVQSHEVGGQKHDKMKPMAISACILFSLCWIDMYLSNEKIEQLFCYEMKPFQALYCFFFAAVCDFK